MAHEETYHARHKDEKRWSSIPTKDKKKMLQRTGSWTDDHDKKLKEMGSSQEDVVTREVREHGKKQYLKRIASKMK